MASKTCKVEDTNDASCLSKYSMVKQGYFDDDYLVHFVSKQPRRSPVIHLGYHVRATVISYILKEFYDKLYKEPAQVISFGAGFDTSFFRLSSDKNKNVIYYEIDLPRVISRKIQYIRESDSLKSIIGEFKVTEHGLSSCRYHLLCADLRDVKSVENRLSEVGICVSQPTLFLSECAITYLDEVKSDDLIQWATKFPNATFVTYEQIEPDDGFGAVMLKHFDNLNTPLQSVKKYSSLLDQEYRYNKLGWQQCISISAVDAYFLSVTFSEYLRVMHLEPFDEWEEFHLKCCHYSLVIASQGNLTDWSQLYRSAYWFFKHQGLAPERTTVSWNLIDSGQALIYGHCSVLFNKENHKNMVFIVGGFGCDEQGAHGRNKHAFTLMPKDCFTGYTIDEKYCCDDNEFSFEAMHATLNLYRPSDTHYRMILYGGRTSPQKCVNICPALIEVDCNGQVKCQPLASSSIVPRWRHSSVIAKQHGNDMFVVFGGCTKNCQVLGDMWKINLSEDSSKRMAPFIQISVNIGARFSHSAAVMSSNSDCDTVVISGGLNKYFYPLGSVWTLDMETEQWHEIDIAGMLPRYGHTSHVVNSTLFLVGGANRLTGQQPGICVVNLQSKTCTEFQFPGMDPEKPIMLINHSSGLSTDMSSILVTGGGGNCFSFGTFFNSHIVQIDLNQFNIV